MKTRLGILVFTLPVLIGVANAFSTSWGQEQGRVPPVSLPGQQGQALIRDVLRMIQEGRKTFRFDTFGDEVFWGDALKLHQAVAGAKLAGAGPGLNPKTALAVGLKVDMDALP